MNKTLKTLAFITLSIFVYSDPIGELEFEISLEKNIKKDIKTILNGDENFIVTVASRISPNNKKVELNDVDLITNNFSSGNILDKYPRFKGVKVYIVLDNSVSAEKESMIKEHVIKKAKIESIRGDTLEITRDNLSPSLLIFFKNLLKKNLDKIIYSILAILALTIIAISIWFLRKNKRLDNTKKTSNNETLPNLQNNQIKEEMINLCLSNLKSANATINKLSETENGKKIASSVYDALGENIFKRVFKGFNISLLNTNIKHLEKDLEKFNLLLAQNLDNNAEVLTPFKFLDSLTVNQIIFLMEEETYPIKTLIISQLSNDKAKQVMLNLDAKEQIKISFELTNLDNIPIQLYENAAASLAKKANNLPHYNSLKVKGYDALLNILYKMDNAQINKYFNYAQSLQPDLYHKIRDFFFVYDDLVNISSQNLKLLLSAIPRKYITESMYNEDKAFKEVIIKSLPKKIAHSIKEELEIPVEHENIVEAKQKVVESIRNQLKEQNITLKEILNKEESDENFN